MPERPFVASRRGGSWFARVGPLAGFATRLGGRAGRATLDALLPPACLACDASVTEQGALCPSCHRALHLIVEPICARCGVPFLHAGQAAAPGPLCGRCVERPPAYDAARAAFAYGEGARRLVLPFKHGDRPDLAGPLARHMARAGAALLARAEAVVPVPLHWRRLLSRRYNQSALLARALPRPPGARLLPGALRRVRATPSLGERGAAERAAVLDGTVEIASPRAARAVAGRRVLLVDDVMTSGATAGVCAGALLAAGAAAVDVLALARVPDPSLEERPARAA